MNRMLVEIWTIKTRMEMRNMLLKTVEEVILIIKWPRTLAELCPCSSVLWKVEIASGEMGYLAETISKQSVEVQLGSS